MYIEKMKKLILTTIIGFIIAFILMTIMISDDKLSVQLGMAFFFSTAAYGWILMNKYVGKLFVGGSAAVVIMSIIIKVLVALVIGWIATPISFIYYLIHIILEKQQSNTPQQ